MLFVQETFHDFNGFVLLRFSRRNKELTVETSSWNRRHVRRPLIESLEQRLQFTILPDGFTESVVAANLGSPTAMDALPDGRLLVTTQEGDLRVIDNGSLVGTPALHLDVDFAGERGLLGVAHDPNFTANHFIYLYHTVKPTATVSTHNQVTRYTLDGDTVLAGSAVEILQLNDLTGATNHNGGSLHFGTDNMLYVSTGENARPDNAQTVGNLLGKILRLNVSIFNAGDTVNDVKLVPADNPNFLGAKGINKVIYALGLRNPFTFGVQPTTGQIFVNDVGQDTWEEIDPLVLGRNYGWGKVEGFALTPPAVGPGPYQDPIMAYNHGNATPVTAATGAAIVGGIFYNPPAGAAHAFPDSYTGKYFFADLGSNFIRTFDPATPGNAVNPDTSSSFATATVGNPTNLLLGSDGSIYYTAIAGGGQLLKITFTAPTTPTDPTLPANTIDSGAVTDSNFKGGSVQTTDHAIDTSHVANPLPQSAYQTYRFGNFSYIYKNLTPGGLYNILLDFSENKATAAGQRVFNVSINGQPVLTNFDIFAEAGGTFIALQKSFNATAGADGKITVKFTKVVGNARVSAISLSPLQSSSLASDDLFA